MLACGGPAPQLFRPGGSGSDDAADGLRTPAVCGRFAFTERFGSPPVQLEVALGPAIERDHPANLAELTCSVFDLEDRQQPVLLADGRKQLNQPPHVRAIVVELLLEHPGLVSRVSPHRCSRHRYHLDGHAHPLAGLPRRYRLASAGAGISAVRSLAIAMASTLGHIDQIGTVSGVVQGFFPRAGRYRRLINKNGCSARERLLAVATHRVPGAGAGDGRGTIGAATRQIVEILWEGSGGPCGDQGSE